MWPEPRQVSARREACGGHRQGRVADRRAARRRTAGL